MTLPEDFGADLSAQIEAAALTQIAPATEQAGTYLVGALRPVLAKLDHLISTPPPGFSDERIASLRFSLALASQTIGYQAGEREALDRAIREYRAVLQTWTREREPLDWAATQNNLGNVYLRLGEPADSAIWLEQLSTPIARRWRSGYVIPCHSTGR